MITLIVPKVIHALDFQLKDAFSAQNCSQTRFEGLYLDMNIYIVFVPFFCQQCCDFRIYIYDIYNLINCLKVKEESSHKKVLRRLNRTETSKG